MHEIEYRIASEKDIDLMMSSRLEMLRVVNGLDADYQFSEDFIHDRMIIDHPAYHPRNEPRFFYLLSKVPL